MTLAVVMSRALDGMDAPPVQVEVHLANGLPSFTLVGLADTEVKEARERVRAALLQSGLAFPTNKRITVNLAPAELPKDSGRFDLPIALGILAADGQIDAAALQHYEFAGELSLAGELRPVRGALALALALGRGDGSRTLVLPEASAREAALAEAVPVCSARHLLDVVAARQRRGPRPGRRARPGQRQTGIGNCRGRRAQPVDGGPAGRRQIDARAAPARPAAADERSRSAGQCGHCESGRPLRQRDVEGAAVSSAAPQRHGTGHRWWRLTTATGRNFVGLRRRPVPR
jgi:Subunit ChlI of Mg-chelatase